MEDRFYGSEHREIAAVHPIDPGIRSPRDLYDALTNAWCRETCSPSLRAKWSAANRTLGQCSVTALLAQDIFGGEVYEMFLENGAIHCYNGVGGVFFDLTSEQFGNGAARLRYGRDPVQNRALRLSDETKRARYELLKARLASVPHGKKGGSPMTDEGRFRFAEKADAPLILAFIQALARYEKMENEVVATPELLTEWLFDKKSAEVLFALEEGREVGFALFFHNFSTFLGRSGLYLEDLFVLPEHRGRGYGKGLIKKLARLAVERGCGRLEWWCLDWNRPSIEFYRSLGAQPMEDWTVYRIAGEALRELSEEKE